MNFELREEQQILKDAARSFLSNECPSTFVREMEKDERGYTPELWSKMAELGWIGFMLPERYGGSEGSFLDLAVLLYEMGYGCLPGPYFSTAVLGGMTLLEGGNNAQLQDILPRVTKGDMFLTLAWTEIGGSYSAEGISLKGEEQNGEYILSGNKLFVPDAHIADLIICAARTDAGVEDKERGISLFLIDGKSPGLDVQPLNTIAGDKQCEVTFDNVRVPRENLLKEPNQGWPILNKVLYKAAVAKCCEMSGGAQKVIDMVVPHVKEREQFGRSIGSFQAVQHHCANILTFVDTSRFMAYQAAWRISEGLPYEKEASMCKAWVNDAYRQLLLLGHQVMGGIGFMEEHDLQLYFRRAKAAELAFGDGDFHREIVAEQLGL